MTFPPNDKNILFESWEIRLYRSAFIKSILLPGVVVSLIAVLWALLFTVTNNKIEISRSNFLFMAGVQKSISPLGLIYLIESKGAINGPVLSFLPKTEIFT